MHGKHLVHHWSRTQAAVAVSSAEAELNAMLKCGQELISFRQLLEEMSIQKQLELRGDSSAALGIVARKGCGKVKHLSVKQLWLQERIAGKEVTVLKVPRFENVADALTHHWSRAGNAHQFVEMGLVASRIPSSRPPKVAEGGCGNTMSWT